MVAILSAVVVFRPDNRQVADLIFGQNPEIIGLRSTWHGILNFYAVFASLLIYFLKSM